jgi:dTDP-glucose 4,6-dehydratase
MHKLLIIGSNSFSGASFIDYALNKDVKMIGTSRSAQPVDALLPYKWRNHEKF